MSLIADALREAARERPATRAVRPTKPLGQIVVPSPRRSRRRRRAFATIGIVAATGLAVAIGAYGYLRFPSKLLHRSSGNRSTSVLPLAPTIGVESPIVFPPAQTPKPAIGVVSPKTPVVTTKLHTDSAAGRTANPIPAPTSPAAIIQQATPRTPPPVVKPAPMVKSGPTLETPIVVTPARTPATRFQAPPPRPALAPKPTAVAPHVADSLFKLAYTAHTHGDLDAAAGLYEQSIATEAAPASVFNNYGVLLEQRGDHTNAARMFRQAIERDNTNVDAWVNLGDALDATNQHDDALSAFARASQLDPSRIAVKTRLATQYQSLGDTASARQFFEDAVKLGPKEPSAHYALGRFLQSQRDVAGAIREYERFVDLAGEQYPANTIAGVKTHILALQKVAP